MIAAPDGSIAGSAVENPAYWYLWSPWPWSFGEYLDSITLTETGTYVIVSASSNGDIAYNTDEQFAVRLYSAPLISGTISIGGPSVTLAPVPGQSAQLTFSGSAGQTISLGYATQYYFPSVSGTNPDGSSFSFGIGSGALVEGAGASEDSSGNTLYYSGPIVLPQNGTYQINIEFLGFTQPVVVNLYDAVPESGTISIGGPAVTVSTGPGQSDNLSFAGTAGEPVSVFTTNSTYNLGDPLVSMTNPDGSFSYSYYCDLYNTDLCLFTLPQTGTNVAQVFAGNHEPGTATLQLFDVTPLNESISINGPPVSVNSNPGQPLALNFSGTLGQSGSLSISDGSSYGSVVVFSPDGSFLVGSPISGSQISVGIPMLPNHGHLCYRVSGLYWFRQRDSATTGLQPGIFHHIDRRTACGRSSASVR